MEKHDLRRLMNALQGRPHLELHPKADQEKLVFKELRSLQGTGLTGKFTNYLWIPKDKGSFSVTPEEAEKLLRDKMAREIREGRAIGFEMDYAVYYGPRGENRIVEVYSAYEESETRQTKRLPGKVWQLEFRCRDNQ